MKLKSIIFIVLIIIIFSSCFDKKNSIITVYHYRKFFSNHEEISDTFYLTKKLEKFNNITLEIYTEKLDDSTFNYTLEPLINFPKSILFINDTCKLISSKRYKIQENEIEIFKYNLNRENSFDEESFIYYNPKVGLIAIYNYPWSNLKFFEYNSTIGLKEKFVSDNTGFVRKK